MRLQRCIQDIHKLGEKQTVEVVRLRTVRTSKDRLEQSIYSETTSYKQHIHGHPPQTNPFS